MDKVIAILKEQEAQYGLNAALKTKSQHEYESAVEEIQLVLQMLQLNKHDVIRWVEFEKQLPNHDDEVVIFNPKRGHKMIIVWCSRLEMNLSKDYTAWYLLPPIG